MANGLFVLYDVTTQEALMLPATQFTLPILNCETTKLDDNERCEQP